MSATPVTYRVFIVDDERIARTGLRAMLLQHEQLRVVGEARNADEAIRGIRELQPDIVFLDIQMPGNDGFVVVRAAASSRKRPAIVFVTAYSEYALEAYEADAVDYLHKPFSESRLARSVQRAMRYLRGTRNSSSRGEAGRMMLQTLDGSVFVDFFDVIMADVEGNYLRVVTVDGDYLIRRTLAEFARDLHSSGFVRVSRSAIVNLGRVRAVRRVGPGRYEFNLAHDRSVVSSRRYQRDVRRAIGSM